MKINEEFIAQMQNAAQLLQTEGPMAATAAIQRALHGGVMPDMASSPFTQPSPSAKPEVLIDINPGHASAKPAARPRPRSKGLTNLAERLRAGMARTVVEDVETSGAAPLKGKFLSLSCSAPAGTRAYKLYIPSSYAGQAMPLVVMLHGCKQNPDDFAAGTGMNALAEEHGCLVAYPAQAQKANGSNCWNWFQGGDQQRDRGEPSIIAEITRDIMRDYKVDPARVYVAGLSAGGAMAAILGTEYPDLYAAVGIHSGLPVGAAHDVASAFEAMRNGAAPAAAKRGKAAAPGQTVPIIVFHGDSDKTVHPRNGHHVLTQYTGGPSGSEASAPVAEKGSAPNGRSYTKTVHRDAAGKLTAEHWTVHGSGHAWSGGSRRGSYTDPKGPDASREMLRFFYENRKNGA